MDDSNRTQDASLRRLRYLSAILAIALWMAFESVASAQVTLTENSNTNWTITNGALTVVFSPSAEKITSLQLGVGAGASPNLLSSLDQEFAGTPFGAGTQ